MKKSSGSTVLTSHLNIPFKFKVIIERSEKRLVPRGLIGSHLVVLRM